MDEKLRRNFSIGCDEERREKIAYEQKLSSDFNERTEKRVENFSQKFCVLKLFYVVKNFEQFDNIQHIGNIP